MGAIASIGSTLLTVANTVMPYKQAYDDKREIEIKNNQLTNAANAQKQKNLLDLKATETDRVAKLRKAIAAQQASFGSQGVGSVTGSSDAVLQGINESSDVARQQNVAKTAADNAAIDSNLRAQRQLNLMQKQQLKQKTFLKGLEDLF